MAISKDYTGQGTSHPRIVVRFAQPTDVPSMLRFIQGLAVFEKEPDAVKTTAVDLLRDGFGDRPKFESLIAEMDNKPVGFALFFPTYSTWEGKAGLHLEDIFVAEEVRGCGAGRALMQELAAIAIERGYARLELSVLHWNPAREFYRKLGMHHLEEWLPYRVSGEALQALASKT